MGVEPILSELKSLANPDNVAGMARYGINSEGTLGISMKVLCEIGKRIGKNHDLAASLWNSGIHEARLLACIIEEPPLVTVDQMNRWASDFDSWDVCDQACMRVFRETPDAASMVDAWWNDERVFVRRAAFALIATLAVHDRTSSDGSFLRYLDLIVTSATDERNMVKKSVNWALRQIGKRNDVLHTAAIACSEQLRGMPSRSARWIGSDALRELTSPEVRERLTQRRHKQQRKSRFQDRI